MTGSSPPWQQVLAAARDLAAGRPLTARDLIRLGETMILKADLWCGNSYGTARADARAAVFHVLAIRDHHDGYLDAHVTRLEADAVLDLFEARLSEGPPLPWLTGEAFHAGRRFVIHPGVFVPRGYLHRLLGDLLETVPPDGRVLDLCTGSGAIGILAALHRKDLRVDLTDVAPEAVANAEENVRRYGLDRRLRVRTGDLYAAADGRYDLILAHPPYVPETERAEARPRGSYEPDRSIYGGADGLEVAQRILAGAPMHLEPGGRIAVEVGVRHQRRNELVGVTWRSIGDAAIGVCVATPDGDQAATAAPATTSAVLR